MWLVGTDQSKLYGVQSDNVLILRTLSQLSLDPFTAVGSSTYSLHFS